MLYKSICTGLFKLSLYIKNDKEYSEVLHWISAFKMFVKVFSRCIWAIFWWDIYSGKVLFRTVNLAVETKKDGNGTYEI